jgi:membrane-associated phospholipid phosphatase
MMQTVGHDSAVPSRIESSPFQWAAAGGLVLALISLSGLAWHGHVTALDRTLTADVVQQPNTTLFHLTDVFSQLGSGPVVGLLSFVIAAVLWRRFGDFFRPLIIIAAGALGGVAEILGKSIVGRLRPPTMSFTGESGLGFPSGHTTGFSAMMVAVAITIPMVTNLAAADRNRLRIVTAVLALMIAMSRVAVGAHYVFDVLAGLALGALCALAARYIVMRFTPLASSLIGRFLPKLSRRIAP